MAIVSYTLQVFVPFFVNTLSIGFKEKYTFSNGHKLRQLIVLNGFYKNNLDTLDSGF